MPTSLDYNYTVTRDNVITRALRIVGAIGQGETPTATAVTEAAQALNDLVKEWAADGMPLWAIGTWTLTPVLSQASYDFPSGRVDVQVAPLKVLQVLEYDSSTTSYIDVLLLTRDEYNQLSHRTVTGTPSQAWYNPAGAANAGTPMGTLTLYPAPDANTISYKTYKVIGQKPFQNFNISTDIPDFPQHFYNALVWGLADQLAYEYGVAYAGRSMITKKAETHKLLALSFDQEEGSFYIQPTLGV